MKYKIIIYKEVKDDEGDDYMSNYGLTKGIFGNRKGQQIFEADMNSDQSIEILQHLYSLKITSLEEIK